MYVLVWMFALLIFNCVILVHELGHYLAARKFNVKVSEFAIGMGPKIFKFEKDGILYSIRCFPIGGFCEMEGEDDPMNESGSFHKKPIWQRVTILVAGAFMNVILGVVFSLLLCLYKEGVPTTTVSRFASSSASEKTGLKTGDEIIAINDYKTHIERDIVFAISTSNTESFKIDVIRNNKLVTLRNVYFTFVQSRNGSYVPEIDFFLLREPKNFVNVINYSVIDVGSVIRMAYRSIVGLILGKFSVKDVAGPVGIASQVGNITNQGLEIDFLFAIMNVLAFMMMVSVSIGIFNLLPFPALDGGRIVMLIPEMLTKKPVSQKVESIVHAVGFWSLMLLLVAVTYNDILRTIKGVLSAR
ncbi:MAG: M50 family metallopeptidase [Firmicutes bacterium]|nr:M50 family metallopeptidase [Bacillota bacterium]